MPIPRLSKLVSILLLLTVGVCPGGAWGGIEITGDNNDYLVGPDLAQDSDQTFSAWVKSDNIASPQIAVINGTYWNWNFYIGIVSSKLTASCVTASPIAQKTAADSVNASSGVWYHLAGVKSGTTIRVYKNGVEVGSDATLGSSSLRGAGVSYVGYLSGSSGPFDGIITEVAIWNVALTDSEIASLASGVKGIPLQIRPSNLTVYLPLDSYSDGTAFVGGAGMYKNFAPGGSNWTASDSDGDARNRAETVLSYPGDE